jgi:hypothetical protein
MAGRGWEVTLLKVDGRWVVADAVESMDGYYDLYCENPEYQPTY